MINPKRLLVSLLILLSIVTYTGEALPSVTRSDATLERSKQLTSLSEPQLMRTLRDSHVVVFGHEPSPKRLAMAWAQVALENGNGRIIWNHNLGNVGSMNPDDLYYYHSSLTNYRAFDGFLDGGIAYWRLLQRCSYALRKFDDGDPKGSAIALKRANYYGADVELYSTGMVMLYWYAISRVVPAEVIEAQNHGQD